MRSRWVLVADCEGLAFSPHCTSGIPRMYGAEPTWTGLQNPWASSSHLGKKITIFNSNNNKKNKLQYLAHEIEKLLLIIF